MLTVQAYRSYAQPAGDEHRRVYRRLPIIFRSDSPEETQVTIKGNIKGKFDSEELIRAMKEVVTRKRLKGCVTGRVPRGNWANIAEILLD